MQIEEYIEQAAVALGQTGYRHQPGNTCVLSLPEGFDVVLEPAAAEEALHLYAPLGPLPAGSRETFFERLLAAQLFHREMGAGCCFGLDTEAGELLLNQKVNVQELSPEAFLKLLNEFANWALYWRQAVSGQPAVSQAAPHHLNEQAQFFRA